MFVPERRQAGDVLRLDLVALGTQLAHRRVHVDRIPEHDEIDEQAEGAKLVFLALTIALAKLIKPGFVATTSRCADPCVGFLLRCYSDPKMIKYNHLVANLLVFHTAVGMTRALENMAADGFVDAISPEALTMLSPYQTEHINRFGDYVLDLSSTPTPLPFSLPERRLSWRQTAAADV